MHAESSNEFGAADVYTGVHVCAVGRHRATSATAAAVDSRPGLVTDNAVSGEPLGSLQLLRGFDRRSAEDAVDGQPVTELVEALLCSLGVFVVIAAANNGNKSAKGAGTRDAVGREALGHLERLDLRRRVCAEHPIDVSLEATGTEEVLERLDGVLAAAGGDRGVDSAS